MCDLCVCVCVCVCVVCVFVSLRQYWALNKYFLFFKHCIYYLLLLFLRHGPDLNDRRELVCNRLIRSVCGY